MAQKTDNNKMTYDSLPLLKISNSPLLSQFLHECVDDLIGKTRQNFDNYTSDIEWTIDDYKKSKKIIQNFYRQSILEDDYTLKIDDLSINAQNSIRKCYEIRKNEIFQALSKENLLKTDRNLVENIDWKLKWVMGSSKLASLKEPLLQVDLHCLKRDKEGGMEEGVGGNKVTKNTVNFEMDLKLVDEFIKQLEGVQEEVK